MIRWSVTVNGGDSELSSFDFTVLMQYPSKRKLKMDFTIDGNDIVIPVNRDLQTEIGKYTLELWANKDKEGQSVIDYCDAFSLVPRSCMENKSQPESDIETVEEISLSTSGIEIGVIGKSAYQIWLENGNEGTEQDFLSWIKQPAEESAQSALSAASQATSAAKIASEKASKADSAASSATSAAEDASKLAQSASSVVEEGNKLIETLKGYEEALQGIPLYENAGTTNEINI